MGNVSGINFMQPYNIVPQNTYKPDTPAMVDVNQSRRADPEDVQIFMNVKEGTGKAEQLPVKYSDLKTALKESGGRADVMSLTHYLDKAYGEKTSIIGLSLGMSFHPSAGCVFSLYDNDSKICMRMGKY